MWNLQDQTAVYAEPAVSYVDVQLRRESPNAGAILCAVVTGAVTFFK